LKIGATLFESQFVTKMKATDKPPQLKIKSFKENPLNFSDEPPYIRRTGKENRLKQEITYCSNWNELKAKGVSREESGDKINEGRMLILFPCISHQTDSICIYNNGLILNKLRSIHFFKIWITFFSNICNYIELCHFLKILSVFCVSLTVEYIS